MNTFDANSWIGRWPFAFVAEHTAQSLSEELREHGIGRALVSPLDAVFAPEPGPANRALLHATRATPGLEPVPVINPVLANWPEELAAVAADERVRAVRVLPSYHNFRLTSTTLAELGAALRERKLKLIVQVRLIDERHEFHALNLKPVSVANLTAFLTKSKGVPLLACGMLRSEILELAPKFPELHADTAFAEWHDTLPHLLTKVPVGQLVFGSGAPLLITAASLAKVATAKVAARVRAKVAAGNLEKFLGRRGPNAWSGVRPW